MGDSMVHAPLECGSAWAFALPGADPLAVPTQATFVHLATLVREACGRHPSVGPPCGGCVPDALPPALGLKQVADWIGQWAEGELGNVDHLLAASIRQSVLHLQMLVGMSRGGGCY